MTADAVHEDGRRRIVAERQRVDAQSAVEPAVPRVDLGAHWNCVPPLTRRLWPVMKSDAGLDRKIAAPTMSSGT